MKWRELTVPERDSLVADKVLGWKSIVCTGELETCGVYWSCTNCSIVGDFTGKDFDRFTGHMEVVKHYTENMQEAMVVIKKMRNDHACQWNIIIDPTSATPNGVTLSATIKGKVQTVAYVGSFLAETICFVALRFLGVDVEWR